MNEIIMTDYLTRMLPELDIETAVEQKNTGAVQKYSRQVELLAMELYHQKQLDKLEQLVDWQRKCIARCSDTLQDTNPIPYEVGRMSGLLELMVQVIRNQHRQVQISTQVAELYKLPHFKEILAAIASNPGIQHAQLAEKIGVDAITLTWIMERMEQAGFVCFVRSGEYKYYKLTASVEPVVYGHWEIEEVDWGFCEATGRRHIHKKFKCSVCGYTTGDQAEKFVCCPICTAKMDS